MVFSPEDAARLAALIASIPADLSIPSFLAVPQPPREKEASVVADAGSQTKAAA
jgi:hypothetical protein